MREGVGTRDRGERKREMKKEKGVRKRKGEMKRERGVRKRGRILSPLSTAVTSLSTAATHSLKASLSQSASGTARGARGTCVDLLGGQNLHGPKYATTHDPR